MPEAETGTMNHWLTVIQIDQERAGTTPETIRMRLEEANIESRPVWKPMHMQPLYKDEKLYYYFDKPNSEKLFNNGICLPSGSNLLVEDQSKIINIILDKLQ